MWPAERKTAVFATNKKISHKNALNYACALKNLCMLNHFDIEQSIAQTNKN